MEIEGAQVEIEGPGGDRGPSCSLIWKGRCENICVLTLKGTMDTAAPKLLHASPKLIFLANFTAESDCPKVVIFVTCCRRQGLH